MAEKERFFLVLKDQLKSRSTDAMARLDALKEKRDDLKRALLSSANGRKRGLIDGGGKILSWLFGVAINEELDQINQQLKNLSTENSQFVHTLDLHATLTTRPPGKSRKISKEYGGWIIPVRLFKKISL